MYEIYKMLFENYVKLNKFDEESLNEINESDFVGSWIDIYFILKKCL